MRALVLSVLVSVAGCDTRRCKFEYLGPVADDEVTGVGTAAGLLDEIGMDEVWPGTWADGTEVDLRVVLARGEGRAEHLLYERKGGQHGFTQTMDLLVCDEQLSTPVVVSVTTADGSLSVTRSFDWVVTAHDFWNALEVELVAPEEEGQVPDEAAEAVWARLVFEGSRGQLLYVSAGAEDGDGERRTLVRAGELPEVHEPVETWVID